MNKEQKYDRRLLAIIMALIGTLLALMGLASLDLPLLLYLAGALSVGGLIYTLFEAMLGSDIEEASYGKPLTKVIAVFIFISLASSTFAAIQSLWISPWDLTRNRFAFENTATGLGFAALVLTLILSTLQKDVYWFTKRKPGTLDERQTVERRAVFEKSYKLATMLLIASAVWISNSIDALPQVLANDTYGGVPGHLRWPIYNLVIALFAIPLAVAAWKKR